MDLGAVGGNHTKQSKLPTNQSAVSVPLLELNPGLQLCTNLFNNMYELNSFPVASASNTIQLHGKVANTKIKVINGEQPININDVFIKLYLINSSLDTHVHNPGVLYESYVYDYITSKIIQTKLSGHFVISFGHCIKSYDEVVDLIHKADLRIKSNIIPYLDYVTHLQAQQLDPTNNKAYSLTSTNTHGVKVASITEQIPSYKNSKYVLQLTEFQKAIPFGNWAIKLQRSNITMEEKMMKITQSLFQIATACFIMGECGLVHNDLHTGNILMQTQKNPVNLRYNNYNRHNVGTSFKEHYLTDKFYIPDAETRESTDKAPLIKERIAPTTIRPSYIIPNVSDFALLYDYDNSHVIKTYNEYNLQSNNNKFLSVKDFAKVCCNLIQIFVGLYNRNKNVAIKAWLDGPCIEILKWLIPKASAAEIAAGEPSSDEIANYIMEKFLIIEHKTCNFSENLQLLGMLSPMHVILDNMYTYLQSNKNFVKQVASATKFEDFTFNPDTAISIYNNAVTRFNTLYDPTKIPMDKRNNDQTQHSVNNQDSEYWKF
jgi:hypothetical protein